MWREVAADLGVPCGTLTRWCEEGTKLVPEALAEVSAEAVSLVSLMRACEGMSLMRAFEVVKMSGCRAGRRGRCGCGSGPRPWTYGSGFDGLFGLVRQRLDKGPLRGDLSLLTNRRRSGATGRSVASWSTSNTRRTPSACVAWRSSFMRRSST